MKVTKGQFKKMLKECIKELLDEGAFNSALKEVLTEASNQGQPLTAHEVMNGGPQHAAPQQQDMSVGSFSNPNERLRALTQQTAALSSGGDPKQRAMLEAIFQDTAQSESGQMIMRESSQGISGIHTEMPVSEQQVSADLNQLKALSGGQGIGRWAAAAFNRQKKG